jgi:site-specific DNA-methyltransferase (adenine-specific)
VAKNSGPAKRRVEKIESRESAESVSYEVRGDRWVAYHANNFRFIEDGCVDLVLTDPPFNIARDTNFHTYEGNTINSYRFDRDKGWDSYSRNEFVALLGGWASEFQRVLRKGGTFAVFCADEYISYLYHALEDSGLSPRRTVTWRKPNAVPVNRSVMMMSSCEYIVVGVKGRNAVFNADVDGSDIGLRKYVESLLVADKVGSIVELAVRAELQSSRFDGPIEPDRIAEVVRSVLADLQPELVRRVKKMYRSRDESEVLEGCVPNLVTFNSKAGNRMHPTEKPVPLLSYLVSLLSEPDALVLDPFSGSSSTAEAAINLGRRVMTVESDSDFFAKGVQRIRDLTGQSRLDFETH